MERGVRPRSSRSDATLIPSDALARETSAMSNQTADMGTQTSRNVVLAAMTAATTPTGEMYPNERDIKASMKVLTPVPEARRSALQWDAESAFSRPHLSGRCHVTAVILTT